MTVMGEVLMKGLSDRGSTPLRSIRQKQDPTDPVFAVYKESRTARPERQR